MALNLALQQAGMTMKDISKVVMDAPTVVSAFASGQIDGAGIWYPLIDTIKEKVPGMKEVASTEDIPGSTFPTAFVSGAKGKPERDRKVVQVLQEANDGGPRMPRSPSRWRRSCSGPTRRRWRRTRSM
ncbi:hypothetical protein SANTM175S_01617 [Streptomyces antimycoticus]